MAHTLAIISVIYQNYTVLDDFLKSLEKQTDQSFHLFLADSSEKKQSISQQRFPVTIIPVENRGYAHGVNMGLKEAMKQGFTDFCVVNDDTMLRNDLVEHGIKSLEHNPQSLIGGKIYYAPSFEYHKDRYTNDQLGKVIWYAGGEVDWDHALTHHRGVDEVDKGQFETTEETGFITGCLMFFDKAVIDSIGFWDSRYFLYYEDADFCERAKRKGVKLYYDPSLVIWHKNAQSTEGSGSTLHQHYQRINRLRFGWQFAPWKTKLHLLKNFVVDSVKRG